MSKIPQRLTNVYEKNCATTKRKTTRFAVVAQAFILSLPATILVLSLLFVGFETRVV